MILKFMGKKFIHDLSFEEVRPPQGFGLVPFVISFCDIFARQRSSNNAKTEVLEVVS